MAEKRDAAFEVVDDDGGTMLVVSLPTAIEIGARLAMEEGCPFTGVSGNFDACSSTTRQVYEERSAKAFGVTLDDYYAMEEDDGDE